MIPKRRCATALFNVAAVVACTGALAQVQGPSVSGGGVPGLLSGGPKPVLVSPANGAQIQTRPTQSTTAQFSWQPPNGPPVNRYILCITLAGASCTHPDAAIYNVGQAQAHQAVIPPRFHDKQLSWTVAACGAGYGGGLAVQGSTLPADCSWAQARTLNAGWQAQAINLLSPGDRVRASTPSQRFTWSAPPAGTGGIDGYRFCLAPSEAACQQASIPAGQGLIVAVPSERTFVDVDIRPLRQNTDRTLKWTVLSCRSGACSLASGQPSLQFIIGAPPPPPTLNYPAAGSAQPERGDTPFGGYSGANGQYIPFRKIPAAIDFRWTNVAGATGYRHCLSPNGVTCGNPGSHVVNTSSTSQSHEWQNLSQFHGQNINWTVASCDALGCGQWASPWPVSIKAVPGTPTLQSPANAADLTNSVNMTRFSWSSVPGAEWYQLSIGNIRVQSNTNSCNLPRGRLPDGPTTWTVEACNVVGCGPSAAPPFNVTLNHQRQPAATVGRSSGSGGSGSVTGVSFGALVCQ
ncbi:MAG TPA: hypothetical protein VIL32_09025 [Steroidobacteraceae bacterium]